jgi:uncharacterized hydrophobic protein (TIGR00271 family)
MDSIARETHLQRWLHINPAQRPAIYAAVYANAEISSLNYWLEIIFSAGIAAMGLVLNSPAVIIGAMLISPLMGPIMAAGLALAVGDLYLILKATANLAASIALAIALSASIVWLLPFHSVTAEVLARINPNLLDLCVALFSGLAGSVAMCRAGAGGVLTLPGVAIAVALMPPLCTIGFGLGSGPNTRIMGGAGLLFLTNLVAIVASAFLVFLLIGMNAPDVRPAMAASRQRERFAQKLASGPLARILANGGQLRWRIVILAVLLASIAVPLRNAFRQLATEAVVRGAVQDVVRQLIPSSALVSQKIEVGRGSVAVRLVSTASLPESKLHEAEKEIERRSGQKADIALDTVASRSELAELSARLAAPAPQPKPVQSIPEIGQILQQRIQPVMQSTWPEEAPLQDYSLSFGSSGIVLNVRYQSKRPLDQIALEIIEREYQEKLGVDDLSLNAQQVAPSRAARARAKNR